MQSLETNFSDLFNSLRALPNNDSSHDNPPSIQESSNQSFVVKSSVSIMLNNYPNAYLHYFPIRIQSIQQILLIAMHIFLLDDHFN
jgi:hypothetical protein